MELSEDVYDTIQQEYGKQEAVFAKSVVNHHRVDYNFPDLDGQADRVGLNVEMDKYREVVGNDGVEAALTQFADDLNETKQRGILEILAAEAYDTEI